MTAELTLPNPAATSTDNDGLTHVACPCNENTALCGQDVADSPWIDDGRYPDDCVVCDDLDRLPCPLCGS